MKKYLKTAAIVLLNVIACGVIIWYFTRNSVLRPYAGSAFKEAICAVLMLASLYLNNFLLYPKLYPKYPKMYWVTIFLVSIVAGVADFAIAYPFMMQVNGQLFKVVGYYTVISTHMGLISVRNLSFNCFLFVIKDRNRSQQSLEKEVQVVYQDVRKIDVADKDSNVHLVSIDDIFYCEQQRNFTIIYTVKNETYTRLGSMKHLEQLLGDEEFIRLTPTLLMPFRYIHSCKDNLVMMRQMPWQRVPTTFPLEARMQTEVTEKISAGILRYVSAAKENGASGDTVHSTAKRKPAQPAEEKVREVFFYIEAHPNCNTADIMAGTDFSLSTVERCLSELKKCGLIEHIGSRKCGGYVMVH